MLNFTFSSLHWSRGCQKYSLNECMTLYYKKKNYSVTFSGITLRQSQHFRTATWMSHYVLSCKTHEIHKVRLLWSIFSKWLKLVFTWKERKTSFSDSLTKKKKNPHRMQLFAQFTRLLAKNNSCVYCSTLCFDGLEWALQRLYRHLMFMNLTTAAFFSFLFLKRKKWCSTNWNI